MIKAVVLPSNIIYAIQKVSGQRARNFRPFAYYLFSYVVFRTSYLSVRQFVRVYMVTLGNICRVVFYFLNCAALNKNLNHDWEIKKRVEIIHV